MNRKSYNLSLKRSENLIFHSEFNHDSGKIFST
jgi:hypothetical protein